MITESRGDLVAAMNVLVRRRASTADVEEQASIDAALARLAGFIQDLNQASLLEAAGVVARAGDELERVVASARLGPFDNFLADMQAVIGRLQGRLGSMQGSERLPPAPAPAARAARTAPVAAASPAPAGGDTPTPRNSRNFDDLRAEYADFFVRCQLRPEFAGNVEFYISRLVKFKPTYAQLGSSLGIPWAFIGVIHGMECGFNFGAHLHNGDPLTRRTVLVPKGRPLEGSPPFTWIDSARDALRLKKLDQVNDWNLPRMLYLWEAYNGFGYRPIGIPTPYLWSFSNLYQSGKFVADKRFDPAAVSKQCGAALMLKVLEERGAL